MAERGDSIVDNKANSLIISSLVPISIIFNHLRYFSTIVLCFYCFSYCLYFHKKWYHWYHTLQFKNASRIEPVVASDNMFYVSYS